MIQDAETRQFPSVGVLSFNPMENSGFDNPWHVPKRPSTTRRTTKISMQRRFLLIKVDATGHHHPETRPERLVVLRRFIMNGHFGCRTEFYESFLSIGTWCTSRLPDHYRTTSGSDQPNHFRFLEWVTSRTDSPERLLAKGYFVQGKRAQTCFLPPLRWPAIFIYLEKQITGHFCPGRMLWLVPPPKCSSKQIFFRENRTWRAISFRRAWCYGSFPLRRRDPTACFCT